MMSRRRGFGIIINFKRKLFAYIKRDTQDRND